MTGYVKVLSKLHKKYTRFHRFSLITTTDLKFEKLLSFFLLSVLMQRLLCRAFCKKFVGKFPRVILSAESNG